MARSLYAPDVVYLSPTTRLFGWPPRIVGIEQALEFIQLTITGLSDIVVRGRRASADCATGDAGTGGEDGAASPTSGFGSTSTCTAVRLRSTYVVVYRYRDALIAQQELYYDPSGELERLPSR